jgi:hypothetical protein
VVEKRAAGIVVAAVAAAVNAPDDSVEKFNHCVQESIPKYYAEPDDTSLIDKLPGVEHSQVHCQLYSCKLAGETLPQSTSPVIASSTISKLRHHN